MVSNSQRSSITPQASPIYSRAGFCRPTTLLQRLEEIDAASTADELLEADIAFHACIAAAAGNVVLASLLDSFSTRTYRARHLDTGLGLQTALVDGRAAHRRIYVAVAARDPEAARASASAHVFNVAAWLRNVVRRPGEHVPVSVDEQRVRPLSRRGASRVLRKISIPAGV